MLHFEKDHAERFSLNVSWTQLDEGRVFLGQFKHTMLNTIKCIEHTALQKYLCCILCDGQDRKNLLKIETDHVDTNVKAWLKELTTYSFSANRCPKQLMPSLVTLIIIYNVICT